MSTALRRNESLLWLALILLTAFALRFAGLDFQSYWYDELFSAHISNPAHSFATVVDLTLADVHPPFYQLMMWLSYKTMGYTEWAGRFPSALVSTATVAVIYFIGKELFNKRVGLYAAALAVANYYLVYYGQEARSYAFLYFLCSLSFLFFVRALRSDSKTNLTLYVIATLLLLYTHYFGFVLLVAQGLCALIYMAVTGWSNRALLVRGSSAAAIVIVCVLPLVPVMTGHAAIDEFWIPQPGGGFVATYFVSYFANPVVAALAALLVFGGIGAALLGRGRQWERIAVLMLLIWVLVGYALPWLRGFVGQPVMTDRNTIMLIVPLLLLAAYGLAAIPGAWAQRGVLAGLVAYMAYFLIVDLNYYERIKKNQFRQTSAAMGEFPVKLPVYTLKFNDTKYNVYFTQQNNGLVAQDMVELEPLLADQNAPSLFWFADGHANLLDTDVDDRYGLIEVGRVRHRSTVAAVMLNPASGVALTLQADGDRYSSAALPKVSVPMLVLVAPGDATQLTVQLVGAAGPLQTDTADVVAALPIVQLLDGIPAGAKLVITGLALNKTPQVWLVPAAALR